MDFRFFRSTFASLILLLPVLASAQLTMRDDAGRPLIVQKPATRIVTLAPYLTEIAFAAGLGDLIVGVDVLSDYPPEARKLPRVQVGQAFSLDQLAPLKPDLVLAWGDGLRAEDVDRITKFGAIVYVANARQLEDVPRLMMSFATLAGRSAGAAAAAFETRLEEVRRANAHKARVTAFVEIWSRPLTTVSGSHVMSEALEICRADNVFKDRAQSAPMVRIEDVRGANPDVIVGAGSAASPEEFRSNWAIRPDIAAVQAKRMIYIDVDTIQRPTPRTPEGIAMLCKEIDNVRPQVATAAVPARPSTAPPSPSQPAAPPSQPAPPARSGRPSQYGL